jgi:Polyketide cyclase / dehydrase and lipid transport
MKSTVDIEIRAPRIKVAELFADPGNNPKWMDDLERIEMLSGELGSPGSRYRMVSKDARMNFVATVVARDLPNEVRLRLDGSDVVVSITDRFSTASQEVTRLVSEEVFTFKGPISNVIGFFAQNRIRKAHRRHMESFKRFAETHDR